MFHCISRLFRWSIKHDIFISYAKEDIDIVENLRSQFRVYGIKAWVYSLDSIITENVWLNIKSKMTEVGLTIFVVSKNTSGASGQQQELRLALDKVAPFKSQKIMALTLPGIDFSALPERLRDHNGRPLDSRTVKSVAWEIATSFFPSLVKKQADRPWKHPNPGDWLRVSSLDERIEELEIGDKLYFRTISPMGLFECYAPKIQGLFWIAPENVSVSLDFENNKDLESNIPDDLTVFKMFEMQRIGWDALHRNENNE